MDDATFAASWLALREPVDHRSRAPELTRALDRWLSSTGRSRVLDLGAGTGSNLRYLEPRLRAPTRWTLVDRDPGLLALAPGDGVDRIVGDLGREGIDAVRNADVVTASALLDLVSEAWLVRVAAAIAEVGAAALFALTWDGSVRWHRAGSPDDDPDDALVLDAVRAHQKRDKGLGPASGPDAAEAARRVLAAEGHETRALASPWRLGPSDGTLASALIRGWADAATEERPDAAERVAAWVERRGAFVAAPGNELVVGHVDLLALPRGR